MVLTVGAQRLFLDGKVFLLGGRRNTYIRNDFPLLRGNQPTILQVLFMRVIAAMRRATERRQDALAIPLLQGVDRFSNQLPKLSR